MAFTHKVSVMVLAHFFGLFLLFVVLIVVILVLLVLLVVSCLLAVILLLFLSSFDLAQCFPLLCKGISLALVVSHDDVVKDSTTLDLPQIEADEAEVIKFINTVIVLVLRICNFLCLPDALVCWIGDSLAIPIALVCLIVLHWCFPLTIFLIIPIVRFLRIAVYNTLLFNPIIWFFVLRIVDHGFISPIAWLRVGRVCNFFGLQHLPIFLDRPFVNLFLVNFNAD